MKQRPSGIGRKVCFDTENRGFYQDVRQRNHMHIIHVIDAETKETFRFFDDFEDRIDAVHLGEWEQLKDGDIRDGAMFLREAMRTGTAIIQNGSGYDWHIFEKIFPDIFDKPNYFESRTDENYPFNVMDTYTMSCTLNPERRPPHEAYLIGQGNVGPHSIAAHGIRIGRYKPEHEDWSHLSLDMMHRVEEDVEIGLDFYEYLMQEWQQQRANPNKASGHGIRSAYYCEHRVAFTMARQAIRGFAFDVGFSSELLFKMDKELNETEEMFRPRMPMRLKKSKTKYSPTQMRELAANLTEAQMSSLLDETHASASATVWSLTNKPNKQGHKIAASVSKHFPEMVGYMEDYGYEWSRALVGGAFTPVTFEDYPLGNRDVVKEILYKRGWLGVNLNDTELEHNDQYHKLLSKGKHKEAELHGELPKPWSGKIDEKSIERWKEKGEIPEWAEGIARWYIVKSRRTQILNMEDPVYFKKHGKWPNNGGKRQCRGLLPRAICQDTGMTAEEFFEKNGMWPDTGHWRIPAIAFHAATNTFRMRHRNVVNIPSRGIYGKEMRKLFIAQEGHQIVGCDGAGLELRMLAHFMNDQEYTDVVLNGDIHTYNQHKANLAKRDMAKTFIYAFLYGSGIPNLARVCGVDNDTMARCIEDFKRSLPTLARLLEGVQKAGARGFLSSVDGRWGRIRKRDGEYALHTALNVLLQMTGSVIMKWGHIIAEDLAVERGLIEWIGDFPIVAHQHDEAQMEVPTSTLEYMEYNIPKSDWDSEEKAEYHDEKGQWSAARIDGEEGDELLLTRAFSGFGNCYAEGIVKAGEMFKLRCPTAGEYKFGDNWYDCH